MFLNWVRLIYVGFFVLDRRVFDGESDEVPLHLDRTAHLKHLASSSERTKRKQSCSVSLRLKKCWHVKLIQEWQFYASGLASPPPGRQLSTLHLLTSKLCASVTHDNGFKIDFNSPPVNRGEQRGGQQFIAMFGRTKRFNFLAKCFKLKTETRRKTYYHWWVFLNDGYNKKISLGCVHFIKNTPINSSIST